MGYFNFYFLKKIMSKLFTKKTLIYIIIFLLIIILKSNVFAVTSSYNVEYDIIKVQEMNQTEFIYHCLLPYSANTDYWNNSLKQIFDSIKSNQYDFFIDKYKTNSEIQYYVRTYYLQQSGTLSNEYFNSDLLGGNYNAAPADNASIRYWTGPVNGFNVYYYASTNSGYVSVYPLNNSYKKPYCMLNVRTQVFYDFINLVYNGGSYENLLSSIYNSLDNIETVNTDILSALVDLSSSLSNIETNTSTDYSQQIGQISNKIEDILDDNDTIISQNADMIQQQEQINENLEQVSQDVQELKDTITDPNISSGASDLPSTNVNDPTSGGIDNIFQSIYNAFCVGEAQDIVFPIPFTDKNITLSPYYVRDMLNNNNAGWIYTLIQAFWGYIIGRYIVSDISKKIDKIKSGDIENVENSNIKEEML